MAIPPWATALFVGVAIGAACTWLLLFRRRRTLERAAIARSRRVRTGQAVENIVPLLPEFHFAASDARFLGSPVDYIVFDGLSNDGADVSVVVVEVKTGNAKLTSRELRIKNAIKAGRVRFETVRLPGPRTER